METPSRSTYRLTKCQGVSMAIVETNHVSAERLREIVTHDDRLFAAEELEHLQSCSECFNIWEECCHSVAFDEHYDDFFSER